MRVRIFPIAMLPAAAGAVLALLGACHPPPDPSNDQPVRTAFTAFKDALAGRKAQQAIDQIDTPSRDYLQGAVTNPPQPTAPDGEVRELIRQTAAKLTPGGVKPGFTLETPLQRVLDAGWMNPQDLDGVDLGPVSFEGNQARAEVLWQGRPTTLYLGFLFENSAWKIDLANLLPYAEIALHTDRAVKSQTEEQQIARLVAMVPAL